MLLVYSYIQASITWFIVDVPHFLLHNQNSRFRDKSMKYNTKQLHTLIWQVMIDLWNQTLSLLHNHHPRHGLLKCSPYFWYSKQHLELQQKGCSFHYMPQHMTDILHYTQNNNQHIINNIIMLRWNYWVHFYKLIYNIIGKKNAVQTTC